MSWVTDENKIIVMNKNSIINGFIILIFSLILSGIAIGLGIYLYKNNYLNVGIFGIAVIMIFDILLKYLGIREFFKDPDEEIVIDKKSRHIKITTNRQNDYTHIIPFTQISHIYSQWNPMKKSHASYYHLYVIGKDGSRFYLFTIGGSEHHRLEGEIQQISGLSVLPDKDVPLSVNDDKSFSDQTEILYPDDCSQYLKISNKSAETYFTYNPPKGIDTRFFSFFGWLVIFLLSLAAIYAIYTHLDQLRGFYDTLISIDFENTKEEDANLISGMVMNGAIICGFMFFVVSKIIKTLSGGKLLTIGAGNDGITLYLKHKNPLFSMFNSKVYINKDELNHVRINRDAADSAYLSFEIRSTGSFRLPGSFKKYKLIKSDFLESRFGPQKILSLWYLDSKSRLSPLNGLKDLLFASKILQETLKH